MAARSAGPPQGQDPPSDFGVWERSESSSGLIEKVPAGKPPMSKTPSKGEETKQDIESGGDAAAVVQHQRHDRNKQERRKKKTKPKEAPISSITTQTGSCWLWPNSLRRRLVCIGLVVTVVVVIVVVVVILLGGKDDDDDNNNNGTKEGNSLDENAVPGATVEPTAEEEVLVPGTLGEIYKHGVLRCGIREEIGRGVRDNQTNQLEGFSVDICRAIGAAVLGADEMVVELVVVTASNRFQMLQSGSVDVLASWDTHTMQRDIIEPSTETGFTFSVPYFYDGLAFAGRPPEAECVSSLGGVNATSASSCAQVSICVVEGTTYVPLIQDLLPDATVTTSLDMQGVYRNFQNNVCNVMAGDQFALAESVVRTKTGYTGEYVTGNSTHSRDPLSLVTNDGDPHWSDLVNWVLEALLTAEEKGFTQVSSLYSFERTDMFGELFEDMFVEALKTVGNYGELYERHFASLIPRAEINKINQGSTGLLYSLPFGNLQPIGPNPTEGGGSLSNIINRGYLRCGVSLRAIFALLDEDNQEWSGFDVDFCRALSAALFDGDPNKVEFSDLSAAERFVALNNGDVDVLSRITTVTFARDVLEPNTQVGFSFTRPDFYDGLAFGGIPPFGQCADNLEVTTEECLDLKICVSEGTTFHSIVKILFPQRAIVPKATGKLVAEGLASADCNAIAGGVIDTSRTNIREVGRYDGVYETGKGRFSKDPLALVTRQQDDDEQWSTFVFWVVIALVYADEEGITQATAFEMPESNLFGTRFNQLFRNVVQNVGSYGEIYNRNVEFEVARSGPNLLNDYPFGPQHFPLPGLK